jgi:hypothetical protein
MVHVPSEFPGDAARAIVVIWRAGQVPSRSAEFGEAVWNLAGYGLACTLGVPQASLPPLGQAAVQGGMLPSEADPNSSEPDDEHIISALESFDNLPPDQKVPQAIPLPIAMLLRWSLKWLVDNMFKALPSPA